MKVTISHPAKHDELEGLPWVKNHQVEARLDGFRVMITCRDSGTVCIGPILGSVGGQPGSGIAETA